MDTEMPMYSKNHDEYFKQMSAWHERMIKHQDQLKQFHQDRANQFRGMVQKRETVWVGNGTT